jgi:hypothetical protein
VRQVARDAGFFVSQECGVWALTGGGPLHYRSVIWGFVFVSWVLFLFLGFCFCFLGFVFVSWVWFLFLGFGFSAVRGQITER